MFVNGVALKGSDYNKSLTSFKIIADCEIVTFMVLTYKNIVFSQNAMGVWTAKLYQFINHQTLSELQNAQTNEQIKGLSEECLLTLVGIKILTESFQQNKAEWKLVVQKGRGILKNKFGMEDQKITQFTNDIVVALI